MPGPAYGVDGITLLEDGVIPSARIDLSVNPTDTNTLTIGADVYEFVNTAVNANVGVDTRKGVVIGGAAANTLTSLIAAINNTVATPHPSLFLIDGVTAALSRGVENVVAVAAGTDLVIRPALSPGGTPVASSPSIALSDALTAVVAWSMTNLNLGGGRTTSTARVAHTQFTVTTAMITDGTHRFDVNFTVAGYLVGARTTGGVAKGTGTDTVALSGSTFTLTLAGGGGDLADGDVVSVYMWS